MNNLSETASAFLKWRRCKIEEEEVYDMFLLENRKEISDIVRENMRTKMINIYDKKCQKFYNKYRQSCLHLRTNSFN